MIKKRFTCWMSDADYALLRQASMRGKISAVDKFERSASGDVTIWTANPSLAFPQLDLAIDFGAITAREAFGQ